MGPMERLIKEACKEPARVVFPEGGDAIMVRGALEAARMGMCKPVFVGTREELGPHFSEAGESLDDVEVVEIERYPAFQS